MFTLEDLDFDIASINAEQDRIKQQQELRREFQVHLSGPFRNRWCLLQNFLVKLDPLLDHDVTIEMCAR